MGPMQTLGHPASTAGYPYAWPERPLEFTRSYISARRSTNPAHHHWVQYAGFGGYVRRAIYTAEL